MDLSDEGILNIIHAIPEQRNLNSIFGGRKHNKRGQLAEVTAVSLIYFTNYDCCQEQSLLWEAEYIKAMLETAAGESGIRTQPLPSRMMAGMPRCELVTLWPFGKLMYSEYSHVIRLMSAPSKAPSETAAARMEMRPS